MIQEQVGRQDRGFVRESHFSFCSSQTMDREGGGSEEEEEEEEDDDDDGDGDDDGNRWEGSGGCHAHGK
jgi:hypothetical protein